MKKIVTIGGGTGHSTLLRALRQISGIHISAIVGMADSGGSSGVIREEQDMYPPGDIRLCLLALAQEESWWVDVCNYRFEDGFLQGHVLGNIILSGLFKTTDNIQESIDKMAERLKVRGDVIPVTHDQIHLVAQLENGEELVSEDLIDSYRENGQYKILRAWLQPTAAITEQAYQAICEADYIICGPGDLYTSLIQNLLVKGMPEAIRESSAKKIYFSSLMTKYGQTNAMTLREQVETLQQYMDDSFDFVIANKNYKFPKRVLKKYAAEKAEPLIFEEKLFQKVPYKIIVKNVLAQKTIARSKGDMLANRSMVRHDSEKMAKILERIFMKKV